MGNEEEGGIVEHIKLALDQASVEKVFKGIENASVNSQARIRSLLKEGGRADADLERYIMRVQARFQKGLSGIHGQLVDKVLNVHEATEAVDRLVLIINNRLAQRIGTKFGVGIGSDVRNRIISAALVKSGQVNEIKQVFKSGMTSKDQDRSIAEYIAWRNRVAEGGPNGTDGQEETRAERTRRRRANLFARRKELVEQHENDFPSEYNEKSKLSAFTMGSGLKQDSDKATAYADLVRRKYQELRAKKRARVDEWVEGERRQDEATGRVRQSMLGGKPINQIVSTEDQKITAKRARMVAIEKETAAILSARVLANNVEESDLTTKDKNNAREEARNTINERLKKEHLRRREEINKSQALIDARNRDAMLDNDAQLDRIAQRRRTRDEKELDREDRVRRLEMERAKMAAHKVSTGTVDVDAENFGRLGNSEYSSRYRNTHGNFVNFKNRWDAPLQGPELPILGLSKTDGPIRRIRQEIVGDTKIISDKADIIRAKIAKAFEPSEKVYQDTKKWLDKLTRLYVVPDRVELNPVQKSVIKQRAGTGADRNELQRRFEIEEKSNQLRGARPTTLGSFMSSFGVDARKADPVVSGLIGRLKELNVTTGQLSNIMPTAAGGFKLMGTGLLNLVKGFGLLYSVHTVISFFKDAIQASNENEISMTRLSVALADVGIRYRNVEPDIQAAFEKQGKLGVSYQQSAETLARLVQITGDYPKSLKALPIIQDIVASGYMTMEQASRAMGKALIGDFGIFSRYGIVLNKNRDVLDQLKNRFAGELLARAKTFGGQIATLTVQFKLLQIAMGDALKQNVEGANGIGAIASMMMTIKKFVGENISAFRTLGGAITAIGIALVAAIAAIGVALALVINSFNSLGVVIYSMARVTVPGMKAVWADFLLFWVHGLQRVDNLLAKILNREPSDKLRTWVRSLTAAKVEANKAQKKVGDEGFEMLQDIWTGAYSQKPGVNSDGPLGHVKPINKEHALRRQAIAQARILALSNRSDFVEQGKTKAQGIADDVNKRLEEEKKDLKPGEQTSPEIQNLEAELVLLDKIKEAREKMDNKRTEAERKYAEMIAHLTAVAHEKDAAASLEAVRQLGVEMEKLLKTRKQIEAKAGGKGSTAWLDNEIKIHAVEEGISARISTQDSIYDKELKRLGDMVDLDENRVAAVQKLNDLYDQAQIAVTAQENSMSHLVVGSDAYNAALDEAIKQRKRMHEIEVAMQKNDEAPGAKIDILEKMLGNPDTRAAAVRDLEALEKHLRDVVAISQKTTPAGKKIAIDQADRIRGIIGSQPFDLRGQDAAITDATKKLKFQQTRKEGVEELVALNDKIQSQLDQHLLTSDEIAHAQAQQVEIQRQIHKAGEPNLNMWTELKDFWDNDLNKSLENVAGTMGDAFELAFTNIMRDSRNLSSALSLIPKGFAKAMLSEIGRMAKGKATENFAWALEETAKGFGALAVGNGPGAAAAFTSAAQHTAAAAAWGLLGGAAGALGISASNAYSNASGDAQGSRGGASDSNNRGGDIYLTIDGVDPSNPRHQRLLGETQRAYRERYGGNIIVTGAGR